MGPTDWQKVLPQNSPEDKRTMAIEKCGETVRHVPFNLVPVVSTFLKRSSNKGLAEVTGNKVNPVLAMGWKSHVNITFRIQIVY